MNKYTDCNQNACDLCDAKTWKAGSTCTGVIGAATIKQKVPNTTFSGTNDIWATGNSNYTSSTTGTDAFHKKDKNNKCYDKTKGLGLYDRSGMCIPGSLGKNTKVLQTDRLVVDGRLFNVFETTDADKFPIQALHKIWGAGPGPSPFNRGVNSRNVYIAPEESVQYTLNKTPGTLNKR